LVGIMAEAAVGSDHLGTMGFMALDAGRYDSVLFSMAGITGKTGVLAGSDDKLISHRLMAGDTNVLEFSLQGNVEGSVGIMAAAAIIQLEMGRPGVA
jgi:hypothetical protein